MKKDESSAAEPTVGDNFYTTTRPWLIRLWSGKKRLEQTITGTYAQVEKACTPIPAGALIMLLPLDEQGNIIPNM